MEINEYVPSIAKIKEMVDWTIFSPEQKWIVYLIAEEKKTWTAIRERWNAVRPQKLYDSAIESCLIRSALSRKWEHGKNIGNQTFLCESDTEALHTEIVERARIASALNTISVRDEALKIKSKRCIIAAKFLRELHCDKLALKLESEELLQPSRAWVNSFIEKIDAALQYPTFIDGKRFTACSNDVIDSFFTKFGTLLRETDELLRFTADETMMETLKSTKVVIPADIKRYVEAKPPELPHITAMCCNNTIGTKPPLFIIIQKKKTIPAELKQLCDTGKIWLVSTPHGWMDRWAFLIWAFCFYIFYNNLKDILPTIYATRQGLLICDGHSSRENPLALQLLHSAKIRVIILPAHTTHVLQLFDVGLAAILKKRFTALFLEMLKKKEAYVEGNMTASMRKIGIEAFIRAWDEVCNKDNCVAAASQVGLNPVSSEAPKTSPYVRDPTEQERVLLEERRNRMRNSLIINNFELTTDEKIAEIKTFVQKSEKDKDLCKDMTELGSLQEIFKFIKDNAASHGVHMLTSPPPFRGMRFDLDN